MVLSVDVANAQEIASVAHRFVEREYMVHVYKTGTRLLETDY